MTPLSTFKSVILIFPIFHFYTLHEPAAAAADRLPNNNLPKNHFQKNFVSSFALPKNMHFSYLLQLINVKKNSLKIEKKINNRHRRQPN